MLQHLDLRLRTRWLPCEPQPDRWPRNRWMRGPPSRRNSPAKSAPSGTRERSSNSSSDRRLPESRLYSSNAGQMRQESLAVADMLAVNGAGACSWAERTPIHPEEMPRLARRQSSSNKGEPTRRLRAPLISKSTWPKALDWSEGGTVPHEQLILAHPAQDRSIVSLWRPIAWMRADALAALLDSKDSPRQRGCSITWRKKADTAD